MAYKVKRAFVHKADDEHLYVKNDKFPREGAKTEADDELIDKLEKGVHGVPYIIDEDAADEVKPDLDALDVKKNSKAELREAAEAKGLEVDESMTKADIYEAIQNAEGTPAE